MNFLTIKKLSTKILLLFIGLSVVPILLFGGKFFSLTSVHAEKEIRAWEKLQPEYVQQARDFHEAVEERLKGEFISFSLYSSFIAFFVALLASGIILRPLRELTEGARTLGMGALDHRIPVRGDDEIADLASAFNAMASSLQERNRELVKKERYVEKMLDPMWVLDDENRVVDINPAFTRLFGYQRSDAIGRPAKEFFSGRSLALFETHAKHKHGKGLFDVYELSIRCSDDRTSIPVLVSCSPITEDAAFRGVIGVFKDISSRKELEEDLFKKNRELYALNTIAAITSHSLDIEEILRNVIDEVLPFTKMDAGGIYLVDNAKKEVRCVSHVGIPESVAPLLQIYRFGEGIPGSVAITGATVAITDITADEGTTDPSLTRTGLKGYVCLPLKSKDKVQGILCMLSADDCRFTSGELEFLESVSHIVGVAIENVGLYERERSWLSGLVSLEKNRAEAILSSIADGVYTTDNDLRITYWNSAAESITGFRRSDVVGMRCFEVLRHEDGESALLCGGRQCAIQTGPKNAFEGGPMYCATRHRGMIPTALSSSPVRDADGNEIGRVTVFRDITREYEIDRMKTDFVRTVSHELRTPLSAIVGMTEMMLDGDVKDRESSREYLATIHTEGQRLASMVEELLDIAKIESGKLDFRKERFPVVPLIDNCVDILAPRASEKGVTVQWKAQTEIPDLYADRGKIHQVVFNILNNALCYSDRGSFVRVQASAVNGNLLITVQDTGWGIPDQDLPHIFKKFYRSKVHAPRVKGSGLGLPLVQEIVRAHGGSIDIKSVLGSGSTFTIRIPFGSVTER